MPDLTLWECCERWGLTTRSAVKARAAALGVELRKESNARTVWPAEKLAIGDELADHLKKPGSTLANFGQSLTPAGVSTNNDTSKQMEDIKKGCLGCLTLIGILSVFIGCSTLFFKPDKPPQNINDWLKRYEITGRWTCEDAIKERLKDPKSMETRKVLYSGKNAEGSSAFRAMITVMFGARNSFGGMNLGTGFCTFDSQAKLQDFELVE